MYQRKVGGCQSNTVSQRRNHGSSSAARAQKPSGSAVASRCLLRTSGLTRSNFAFEAMISTCHEVSSARNILSAGRCLPLCRRRGPEGERQALRPVPGLLSTEEHRALSLLEDETSVRPFPVRSAAPGEDSLQ